MGAVEGENPALIRGEGAPSPLGRGCQCRGTDPLAWEWDGGARGRFSVTWLSPIFALQDHLQGCLPAGVQAAAPARGLVLSRLEQS